jgi:FtsH-binding integral membrane protein
MSNKSIVTIIASGLLFIALSDGLPYGYFTFLRFVVCAVGAYLAYKTYEVSKESLWVWAFAGIAILFNPIIPIYLQREQWVIIDLIVGVFFLLSIFIANNRK